MVGKVVCLVNSTACLCCYNKILDKMQVREESVSVDLKFQKSRVYYRGDSMSMATCMKRIGAEAGNCLVTYSSTLTKQELNRKLGQDTKYQALPLVTYFFQQVSTSEKLHTFPNSTPNGKKVINYLHLSRTFLIQP